MLRNLIFYFGALILTTVLHLPVDAHSGETEPQNTKYNIVSTPENYSKPVFIPNQGQITNDCGELCPDVLYALNLKDAKVYLRAKGVSYVFIKNKQYPAHTNRKHWGNEWLQSCVYRVDLDLLNAQAGNRIEIAETTPIIHHYYYAHCPKGITVKSADKIIYKNIYNNVDWILSANDEGEFKHDFVIHPGGNMEHIQMQYSGYDQLYLNPQGNLCLLTPLANLTESIPEAFRVSQHTGNSYESNHINKPVHEKQFIPIAYKLKGNCVSFVALKRLDDNPLYPTLVIDPLARIWATLLGGGSMEHAADLTTDLENNPIITGFTGSTDFPTSVGVVSERANGANDVFVAKLSPDGKKIWATYIGGRDEDRAQAINLAMNNHIGIVGVSRSPKFPTTDNAIAKSLAGDNDAFITQLTHEGKLAYSTYLGGKGSDEASGIAFDSDNNMFVGGTTESIDFPTTPQAYQARFQAGGSDAFLVRINKDGKKQWSTFIGGHSPDQLNDLAFMGQSIYITGTTRSTNFPVTRASTLRKRQIDLNGDVFFTTFDSDGSLLTSVVYGGSNTDEGLALAVDSEGNATICGHTQSLDFPVTQNAFQDKSKGLVEGFLTQFTTSGEPLWATYYGGSGIDHCFGISVNPRNRSLYLVGKTNSKNFPTTGDALMFLSLGTFDAFISHISNAGRPLWTTYYGGVKDDEAYAVAADFVDNVYVAGRTVSNNFPLAEPSLQSKIAGNWDNFIIRFRETDPTLSAENTAFENNEIPPDENIFTFKATVKDVKCKGGADGAIDMEVTGGTPPYTFAWSNGATTQNLKNIPAGKYTLTVTDVNGLSQEYYIETAPGKYSSKPLEVKEPINGVQVSLTPQPPKCPNGNDGRIMTVASGGQGPYTYRWSSGSTEAALNGVEAGTFTVTVTDAGGCTATASVKMEIPQALTVVPKSDNASCGGSNDGKISLQVSGGTPPYSYTWSNGATSKDLTGLAGGSYTVTVADKNNCTMNVTAVIAQGASLQAVATATAGKCDGAKDGTISVQVTGGTPPFTYKWNNGAITKDLINVVSGTYTVTIADKNNCSATASGVIAQASALKVTLNPTNPLCHDTPNGAIEALVVGGKEPFIYNWSNGQTTSKIIQLAEGSYSLTVTDANGCKIISSAAIKRPAQIVIDIRKEGGGCSDAPNSAKAIAGVSGGTPPLKIEWSNGSTSNEITNLTTGDYTINVTDGYGCKASKTVKIIQSIPITATVFAKELSCEGGNSGGIDVTVNGGVPPMTFLWSNGVKTEDLTNIPAGTYTLTITDANKCTITQTATLKPKEALKITEKVTQISCNNGNNGEIQISVSGGAQPYTYAWTTGSTLNTIKTLNAGTYGIEITDANGCKVKKEFTLIAPAPLTVVTQKTDASCDKGNDGKINTTVTGGTQPYKYEWSNGASTQNIIGLSEGSYTLKVTDAKGCTAISGLPINRPKTFQLQVSKTDLGCSGANDGTAKAEIREGNPPFAYAWSNGNTSPELKGLKEGLYSVTVTDGNGCKQTGSVTLSRPPAIVAKIIVKNITCADSKNGQLQVNSSGGKEPFTYKWSNGSTEKDISGLLRGAYNLTITDANGCSTTLSANISEPAPLEVSINAKNVSCGGLNDGSATPKITGGTEPYKYVWSNNAVTQNLTGVAEGIYTLKVTDANGCTTENKTTITKPESVTVSIDKKDLSCGGTNDGSAVAIVSGGKEPYTFAWSNLSTKKEATLLKEGEISVVVTDANGCKANAKAVLNRPPAITLKLTRKNIGCSGANDGSITANISGGKEPFASKWSNGNTETNISNLSKGTYSLTVSDANGCTATSTATIDEPNALSLILTEKNVSCGGTNDGGINAKITGGTEPYKYVWNNNTVTQNLTGVAEGTYTLKVTDANGCTTEKTATLSKPSSITVSIDKKDLSCGGTNDGSAVAIVSGGKEPYTFAWSNLSTKKEATLLKEGEISVVVTDANGCKANAKAVLNRPPAITLKLTRKNIGCSGANDGSITANISGGKEPFASKWSNGNTETKISNLSKGTYSLTVSDANGCTATSTATIDEPNALSLILTEKNVSCGGTNDGGINAKITGGTEPYKYVWSNNAVTQNLTGVAEGTYTLKVTDANGCTTEKTATLSKPSSITVSIDKKDLSCGGTNDGSAVAIVSGGKEPYTFAWSNLSTKKEATLLKEGEISVVVTDANGCKANAKAILSKPGVLTIKVNTKEITCASAKNGRLEVVVSSGKEPFIYTWSNLESGKVLENQPAGNYSVTVLDANGCKATANAVLMEPSPLTLNIKGKDLTCGGTNDGSVTTKITGGTEPYKYIWNNKETTQNLTAVAQGTYNVTVTDANGCKAEASTTLTKPASMTISVVKIDLTCSGLNDGSAKVAVIGGKTPYVFTWSNAATTQEITKLGIGTYSVTVTDGSGCKASESVTLNKPPTLSIKINKNDITCANVNDGKAEVKIVEGREPFSYVWSNQNTNAKIEELAEGTYTVTVSDANGCKANASVSFKKPTAINVNLTAKDLSCGGTNDGAVTSKVTGGIEPYKYLWSNGQTTSGLKSITEGTYKLTVTDANGCVGESNVNVTKPLTVNVSIDKKDLSCGGTADGAAKAIVSGGKAPYTYAWSTLSTKAEVSLLKEGEVSVTVTDAIGCKGIAKATLSRPGNVTVQLNIASLSCADSKDGKIEAVISGGKEPYTIAWSNQKTTASIENLADGVYTVTVSDKNGCKQTANATIKKPEPLNIKLTATDLSCGGGNDGKISAKVSGGTTPYTYKWSNGSTEENLTAIDAGEYKLEIKDAKGCKISESATLKRPSLLKINLEASNIKCYGGKDGSIKLNINGGNEPFTIKWGKNETTKNLTGLATGEYSVTVSDAKGCTATEKATLTQPEPVEVTANGSLDMCEGQKRELTVAGVYKAYKWTSGETTPSIIVTKAGTYGVELTTESGCKTTAKAVKITVALPPKAPQITNTNDTLRSTKADRYQWYKNNVPINSGINSYFVAEEKGEYKVRITDERGCTATSSGLMVSPKGQPQVAKEIKEIEVYPNPTFRELNIEIKNTKGDILDVIITAPNGTVVYKKRIAATERTFTEYIEDLKKEGTPPGKYVLSIKGKVTNIKQTITVN